MIATHTKTTHFDHSKILLHTGQLVLTPSHFSMQPAPGDDLWVLLKL